MLLLAVSYTIDPSGLFMIWLGSVILHETAHIAALYLCGGRIAFLTVRFFGAELREVPRMRPAAWRLLIPVAAGPISNFLAAYLFAAVGYYLFAGVHFLMGMFNMLPLPWLDGGRLVQIAVHHIRRFQQK